MCIIAVVLIHTATPPGDGSDYLHIITRGFINFPVAVFFFLAGYFNKSEGTYLGNEKGKLLTRIFRLLTPYLFWTAFYLVLNFAISQLTGVPFDVLSIPKALLTGSASGPLYFLNVLLQLTIITPILVCVIKGKGVFLQFLRKSLFLITPVYLLGVYVYDFSFETILPHYGLPCFAWFVFYYAGLWVKNGREFFMQVSSLPVVIFVTFVALFFAIWEGVALFGFFGENLFTLSISQTRIGSMLFSLAFIGLILKLKDMPTSKNKILSTLGDYSFGIYAFHMFWMLPCGMFFSRYPLPWEFSPVQKIIQGSVCMGLTFVALKIGERILGEKTSKKIGLR